MSKRKRRVFTEEQKLEAVSDYTSERKTAAEVASDLNIAVGQIYRWKAEFERKNKEAKIQVLVDQGLTVKLAKKIQSQQDEIELYQKKLAEQAVIIDLLKKLQTSASSPLESELSGWIDTTKKWDRKRKPVKS